jgi:hypothetical protein
VGEETGILAGLEGPMGRSHDSRRSVPLLAPLALATLLGGAAPAADHADTPLLVGLGRHDARLTDLHAFRDGDRYVLSLCTNPAIPASVTTYRFSSDLEFTFHLDVDAPVVWGEHGEAERAPAAKKTSATQRGWTLLQPGRIAEDLTLTVTFRPDGLAEVEVWAQKGIDGRAIARDLRLFTGLRDDPFIRGPREGFNVAAVVVELPLRHVWRGSPGGAGAGAEAGAGHPFLVWAVSRIRGVSGAVGDVMDMAAQPLSSQLPANMEMNFHPPRDQWQVLGRAPDVLVCDPSRQAGVPNGRRLEDDVVDLYGDAALLASDAPFPSANDRPFLPDFPYLAPPHAP